MKSPAVYGTRNFVTAFRIACRWTLSKNPKLTPCISPKLLGSYSEKFVPNHVRQCQYLLSSSFQAPHSQSVRQLRTHKHMQISTNRSYVQICGASNRHKRTAQYTRAWVLRRLKLWPCSRTTGSVTGCGSGDRGSIPGRVYTSVCRPAHLYARTVNRPFTIWNSKRCATQMVVGSGFRELLSALQTYSLRGKDPRRRSSCNVYGKT
jgi:hypothetical protein